MPPIKRLFLLHLLLFMFVTSYAQRIGDYSYQPNIPVTPPSPDAAALGKFGDVPVSLYTGIPSISVPIFNLTVDDYTLPISLDYHAGGIKVDEIASSVGLGWGLSAGGVVTCKVNGAPDRYADGTWIRALPSNMNTFDPNASQGFGNSPYINDFILAENATDPNPAVDMMPDEFFYNFGGRSGKIVFDENQIAHTIPFEPIKIQGLFSIRDENGILFDFNATETTSSTVACTPTQPRPSHNGHISSYYLSKITTLKGNTITFNYENITSVYDQSWTESSSIVVLQSGCAVDPLNSHCKNQTTIRGVRITSISASNGITVTFNYDPTNRDDLPGTNRLASIVITDPQGNQKTFTLTHTYFGSTGSKRLKLDAILEAGKKPYTFDYIQSNNLPARLSNSQDHWGYYNGASNSVLIPTQDFTINNKRYRYTGANREPNADDMAYGTLNKITYPTGGSTVFEYEPNRFLSSVPEAVIINQSLSINAGVYDANDNGTRGIASLTAIIDQTTYPDFTGGACTSGYYPVICPRIQWMLPDPNVCRYTVNVSGPDGVNLCCFGQTQGEILLNSITPGQWRLNVNISRCDVGSYAQISLNWADVHIVKPYSNKITGGLRVKSVKNYDGATLVSEKDYEYVLPDNTDKSSGKSIDVPKYYYDYVIHHPTQNSGGGGAFGLNVQYGPITEFCQYFGLTSYSGEPLGSVKSGSVGYTDVTVYDKGGSVFNGKTYNKFKFIPDLTPSRAGLDDYLARKEYTSYDFLRGLPEETTVFKSLPDGSFTPVQKTTFDYNIRHDYHTFDAYQAGELPNEKNILGISISQVFTYGLNEVPAYGWYNIKYPSVWYSLSKKTEHHYEGGSDLVVETNFAYDNPSHAQATRESTTNSLNETITACHLFPADYTNTSGFIFDMKQANIIKPIEQINYKTDNTGANPVILSGSLNTYKSGAQAGLLESTRFTRNAQAVAKQNFKFSNQSSVNSFPYEGPPTDFDINKVDVSYPALIPDYTFSYDANNNMASVQKSNDLTTSYLWGYNYSSPIAKTTNAKQNEVAYTSFENETSLGNWEFSYDLTKISTSSSKTGTRSYASNAAISKSNLPTGNYRISFWAIANNGLNSGNVVVNGQTIPITDATWQYKEVILTNTTLISITINWLNGNNGINIDELRLCPVTAQMTTYSTEGLKGTTAIADPNSKPTTFEYDQVQRLINVKDNDSNILKNYQYHYKNQ